MVKIQVVNLLFPDVVCLGGFTRVGVDMEV